MLNLGEMVTLFEECDQNDVPMNSVKNKKIIHLKYENW